MEYSDIYDAVYNEIHSRRTGRESINTHGRDIKAAENINNNSNALDEVMTVE